MLKLAALAYGPVAAVTFGVLVLLVIAVPGMFRDFEVAAWLYFGAALLSLLIAVPLAMMVAHRMLTRRERRLLDAHAGVGR
ncbi:MAG: hypothetical protein AB7I59_30635 [Geminicoccaceae bacterium]